MSGLAAGRVVDFGGSAHRAGNQFFRHQSSSFNLVRDYVQALFAGQPERKQADNVWSVGCSTGEEPMRSPCCWISWWVAFTREAILA